jgi:hypothetical protein
MTDEKKPRKKLGTLTDESVMAWGKYKGMKLANIPPDYFLFLNDQPWLVTHRDVFLYVKENLDVFKAELKLKRK